MGSRAVCGALLVVCCVVCLVGGAPQDGKSKGCTFPPEWEGQWFQLGLNLVTINGSQMFGKGHCVSNDGPRYIMMDKGSDGRQTCYGCMIIWQRHIDVLQYKEAWPCPTHGEPNVEELCSDVHSDNPLHSMFRKEPKAGPVRCPFARPPYTFSYNKGTGECVSPVSRVDACMDSSRLLIRNAACADVLGTQDLVEELECLATWRDGPYHYMVGKLSRPELGAHQSDEDRYRCFVYEDVSNTTTQVAISPDATCVGIPSPSEGSKVMKLTRADLSHTRCKFPAWVTQHRHWFSLDHARQYNFSHTNASFRHEVREDPNLSSLMPSMALTGHNAPPSYSTGALAAGLQGDRHKRNELLGVCHSLEEAGAPPPPQGAAPNGTAPGSSAPDRDRKQVKMVVHVTSGCESGFICMIFYERDSRVIEVQQSHKYTTVPEEACSADFFDPKSLPYVTLTTYTLRPRKCPHVGRYSVTDQLSQPRQKRKAVESGSAASDPDGTHVDNFADCSENNFHSLVVGCQNNNNVMEFHSKCTNMATSYSCHGTWEENGTSYLIASTSKAVGAKRFCFIYTRELMPVAHGYNRLDGKHGPTAAARRSSILRLSTVAESCLRDIVPGHNGALAFNLTVEGQCDYGIDGTDGATTAQLSGILITSAFIVVASLSALR